MGLSSVLSFPDSPQNEDFIEIYAGLPLLCWFFFPMKIIYLLLKVQAGVRKESWHMVFSILDLASSFKFSFFLLFFQVKCIFILKMG